MMTGWIVNICLIRLIGQANNVVCWFDELCITKTRLLKVYCSILVTGVNYGT